MDRLSTSPQLVMVAGVNGAGKSTITARLRQSPGFPSNYINPDEIALTLTNITDPSERAYTAAKKADLQRENLLEALESMAFETFNAVGMMCQETK